MVVIVDFGLFRIIDIIVEFGIVVILYICVSLLVWLSIVCGCYGLVCKMCSVVCVVFIVVGVRLVLKMNGWVVLIRWVCIGVGLSIILFWLFSVLDSVVVIIMLGVFVRFNL